MKADEPSRLIDLAREPALRVGVIEVRPATREVLAQGSPARLLEPRIMQVLVALARRLGEVVSRDDLIAECWGGRVVGDDAINRCVQAIRKLAHQQGGFSVTTIARIGYRLEQTSAGPPTDASTPTLAVLAFDNLSGDPELGYFSDGVSEEILHAVARLPAVRVIGRSSSFQFRGTHKASSNVATQLRASHILDGSVRRGGDTVRVAASLIECAEETVLWSGRYDRALSNILSLQEEIAAAVAAALRVSFVPRGGSAPVAAHAYDLYLRARSMFQDDFRRAEALLEEASAGSPDFAEAWGFLAWLRAWQGRTEEQDGFSPSAQALAVKTAGTALRIDPKSALATAALSYLAPFSAFLERERLLAEALTLSPNDATLLAERAACSSNVGRFAEALAFASDAYRVDPLFPFAVNWYASCLCNVGRWDDGYAAFAEGRRRWPSAEVFTAVPLHLHAGRGEWRAFDELAREARVMDPLPPHVRQGLFVGRALRDPTDEIKQRVWRNILDLAARPGAPILAPLVFACDLGLRSQVFELLETISFEHVNDPAGSRPSGWADLGVIFSASAGLFRDRRFVDLCRKLGLCDYWVRTERWPDCAEPGVLTYEFRAECCRLVDAGI